MRILPVAAIALMIPAAAFASTQAETRIADGFMHLGTARTRAVCYGATIGGRLDQQQANGAASIVESASSSRQVRVAVMNSSKPIIDAFMLAHQRCGGR
jgi:hypothetical protein